LNFGGCIEQKKLPKKNYDIRRLKAAFDSVGFKASDDKINMLADEYITYVSTFLNVFEGTFEISDYLKTKCQLHIITNGFNEIKYRKLRVFKLLPYFI